MSVTPLLRGNYLTIDVRALPRSATADDSASSRHTKLTNHTNLTNHHATRVPSSFNIGIVDASLKRLFDEWSAYSKFIEFYLFFNLLTQPTNKIWGFKYYDNAKQSQNPPQFLH